MRKEIGLGRCEGDINTGRKPCVINMRRARYIEKILNNAIINESRYRAH